MSFDPNGDDLTNLSWLQNASLLLPNCGINQDNNNLQKTISAPASTNSASSVTKKKIPKVIVHSPGCLPQQKCSHHNHNSVSNVNSVAATNANGVKTEKQYFLQKKSVFCEDDKDNLVLNLVNSGAFRMNPDVKPPFSYAAMICLAMRSAGNGTKLSLSQIYKYIAEKFPYYKKEDATWQVIHI